MPSAPAPAPEQPPQTSSEPAVAMDTTSGSETTSERPPDTMTSHSSTTADATRPNVSVQDIARGTGSASTGNVVLYIT